MPPLPVRPRRGVDDKLDVWLIEGSESFSDEDRVLARRC